MVFNAIDHNVVNVCTTHGACSIPVKMESEQQNTSVQPGQEIKITSVMLQEYVQVLTGVRT